MKITKNEKRINEVLTVEGLVVGKDNDELRRKMINGELMRYRNFGPKSYILMWFKIDGGFQKGAPFPIPQTSKRWFEIKSLYLEK